MSKGGHFLRLALAAGKKLYGHGPSCPPDCACRAAELALNTGVSMLEGAVAHSRSRKARVHAPPIASTPPAPASRPVVVEVIDVEVIDVEVIEVDGVPVRPPPRLPSRPRSLPAGRSRR